MKYISSVTYAFIYKNKNTNMDDYNKITKKNINTILYKICVKNILYKKLKLQENIVLHNIPKKYFYKKLPIDLLKDIENYNSSLDEYYRLCNFIDVCPNDMIIFQFRYTQFLIDKENAKNLRIHMTDNQSPLIFNCINLEYFLFIRQYMINIDNNDKNHIINNLYIKYDFQKDLYDDIAILSFNIFEKKYTNHDYPHYKNSVYNPYLKYKQSFFPQKFVLNYWWGLLKIKEREQFIEKLTTLKNLLLQERNNYKYFMQDLMLYLD